ncbi:MAG TPA: hypothetical protein DEQ30_12515 [Porphyromonadaceae bacterium]|nr:hypothetical protein [Porphyromonadaceae bacterium]
MVSFSTIQERGNRYFTDIRTKPYLGVHGFGDNIYVFEQYMNHKHINGDHPPMRGLSKESYCGRPFSYGYLSGLPNDDYIIANAVPFFCASLYAKKLVIEYMARIINIRLPIIMDENRDPRSYAATRIVGNRPNKLVFNPYSDNIKRGNYFDIYLNLVHEKNHIESPGDAYDTVESEYDAYEEVFLHRYFKYASPEYQRHVNMQLSIYANELRKRTIGKISFRR